jgi:hypothetical protein
MVDQRVSGMVLYAAADRKGFRSIGKYIDVQTHWNDVARVFAR